MIVAGALFGMWRGMGWAALLSAINIALYAREGILAGSTEQLVGNLLSVAIGIGVAGVVGRIFELTTRLSEEVEGRRIAEARKQELTALLVHDLNNPITAIIGHADVLPHDAGPDPRAADALAAIADAAERMRRMLLDLLDIGRAEDGQLELNVEQVDLARLLDELRAQFARHLAVRRQTLEVQLGDEHAPFAHADPELFRRMLANLLENAVKYSPRERTIRLEIDGDAQHLEVRVRDQGPGIPREDAERIFEKYARLDRDKPTAANVSRGLGLAFCKLAAKAHGGDIWVEPSAPTGSVFRLRLPRRAGASTQTSGSNDGRDFREVPARL